MTEVTITQQPLHRIETLWMLSPFVRQLEARQHDTVLLRRLEEMVDKLLIAADRPGLNVELLDTVGRHRVYSARIAQGPRALLVDLGAGAVGALYFDQHDAAYDWLRRKRASIPTMLSRLASMPRGWRAGERVPVPSVRLDEEEALPVHGIEDIRLMLAGGIARYLTTLDDSQRRIVEFDIAGRSKPYFVKGGAGTGKTAVALARMRHLAVRPEMERGRVLYLCYNRTLMEYARAALEYMMDGLPASAIEVDTVHGWCTRLLRDRGHTVNPESSDAALRKQVVRQMVDSAPLRAALAGLSSAQIVDEIVTVLRPLEPTEDEYLQLERRGRRKSLGHNQRRAIFGVWQQCRPRRQADTLAFDDLPQLALAELERQPLETPYRAVVLDEAQDCGRVMIRLAKRLAGEPGRLMVLADEAQGIYSSGFYWAKQELGRGGSPDDHLRKNYRTTAEVQQLAMSIYHDDQAVTADVRQMWKPERHGPTPTVLACDSEEQMLDQIGAAVRSALADWAPECIVLLAPEHEVLQKAAQHLSRLRIPTESLGSGNMRALLRPGAVRLATIHASKGLDFPVVFLLSPRARASAQAHQTPEQQGLWYVGLTRAAYTLTIGVVIPAVPATLRGLAGTAYRLDGPAAARWSVPS